MTGRPIRFGARLPTEALARLVDHVQRVAYADHLSIGEIRSLLGEVQVWRSFERNKVEFKYVAFVPGKEPSWIAFIRESQGNVTQGKAAEGATPYDAGVALLGKLGLQP